MKKSAIIRRLVAVGAVIGSAGMALAQEGGDAFDAASTIASASTTVTTIVTAVGSLLGAAILLYVGFVGYRKGREALNKV